MADDGDRTIDATAGYDHLPLHACRQYQWQYNARRLSWSASRTPTASRQATRSVIDIVDDVPNARNDTDSVASATTPRPATSSPRVSTDGGAGGSGVDTAGPTTATLTAVTGFGATSTVSRPADFRRGRGVGYSTIGADGEYSYVRDADAPNGETDTFTYTLTDGTPTPTRRPWSSTIENGDRAPRRTIPPSVDDEGLAGGITGGDGDVVVPYFDGDGDELLSGEP